MLLRSALLILSVVAVSHAAVRTLLVRERTELAGGTAFGNAGPYERIIATAHYVIDPQLPQNRAIVDIDLAPRNKNGMVEFSGDVLILRPKDLAKSNGTAIVDVPNRGRLLAVSTFNRGPATLDPKSMQDVGDGLLMREGFTVVSVGWQWDEPHIQGRLGLQAPILPGVTGLVRAEVVPDTTTTRFSLADRDHIPYPVADEADDPANRLYVRRAPGMPRREIPRARWRFADKGSVEVDGGCEPGQIYEVVYKATGAVPVGLGFAAVRDMASFLKNGDSPLFGGDRPAIHRTIGFGVSQTGRFLRHMMYAGFNQDEKDRKALDGVWADVAGAGRGTFNQRFGQPSRDGQPLLHYSWAVDIFPFTDSAIEDPVTGRKGGLLARAESTHTTPKVLYTNHSYEYWGRAASLIHTTPDAKTDIPPSANTRIYFIAGGQHGSGSLPLKKTNTQNLVNPLDIRWPMRALLIAFHQWLKDGVEPPASVYPRIASAELTTAGNVKYPSGTRAPKYPRTPQVLDFGSNFLTKGIVEAEPPAEGASYSVLVPQVDRDGNERGGVRLPDLDVPLGFYTGWNLRDASIGSSDRMIAFTGSFFPFKSAEIHRRYANREAYLAAVTEAGKKLTARRLALASDLPKMVEISSQLWDEVLRLAQ